MTRITPKLTGSVAILLLNALLLQGSTSIVQAQEKKAAVPLRWSPLWMPVRESFAPGTPAIASCIVRRGMPIPVVDVAFSPDGQRLASTGYQEVLLWDMKTGALKKRISGDGIGQVKSLAFIDKQRLAVGEGSPGDDGSVRIFNIDSGSQIARLDQPAETVNSLAVSPDGKLLAGACADHCAYLWKTDDYSLVKKIQGHSGRLHSVAFNATGTNLVTAGKDSVAKIWKSSTGEFVREIKQKAAIRDAVFTTDGKVLTMALCGSDQWGVVAVAADGKKVRPRPIYFSGGRPLDLHRCDVNKMLFVAASNNVVRAYEIQRNQLTKTFYGHADWVYAVDVSPDGKRLATGSADGTVRLWDIATGRMLVTLVQMREQADDWAAVTPRGYGATSVASLVQWRQPNAQKDDPNLAKKYLAPEQVEKALATAEPEKAPTGKRQKK